VEVESQTKNKVSTPMKKLVARGKLLKKTNTLSGNVGPLEVELLCSEMIDNEPKTKIKRENKQIIANALVIFQNQDTLPKPSAPHNMEYIRNQNKGLSLASVL